MGYWKEKLIEMNDTPWYGSDRRICVRCVNDPVLIDLIIAEATDEDPCSFCGAAKAADFDVILGAISGYINSLYTDPAEELPYESAEGGYQGTVYDGSELVYELDEWTDRDEVVEEAASAFVGSAWCEQDYFSLGPYETLRHGWERFVEQIKHVTRYLFLREDNGAEDRHDEIRPSQMLDALGRLLTHYGTFTTLPEATEIWRARTHKPAEIPTTVDDLGAPPLIACRASNRMSPAGISMFYGALDLNTSVAETVVWNDQVRTDVTGAVFQPAKPLLLLDLTKLPEMPSQFDEENRHLRAPLAFLRSFAHDLTKPVARDGYEHVDYVPTQVVTEYVRYQLKAEEDKSVDGIMYTSSRNPGGVSLVLFIDGTQCGPRPRRDWWDPEPVVKLVRFQTYSVASFLRLKI